MLVFYGDESFGHQEPGSSGAYVVAGYTTDSDLGWKPICTDWETVLRQKPSIQYFHMTECHSLKGEFAGFKRADADTKRDQLIGVLEYYGNGLAWIDSIVTWDIYNNALGEAAKQVFRTPFSLCMMSIISQAVSLIYQIVPGSDLPLEFTFDEHGEAERLLLSSYRVLKDKLPDLFVNVGEILFRDDKITIPLQCADLLAWHVRRNYLQLPEDHGRETVPYQRLRKTVSRMLSSRWNESELKKAHKAIDARFGMQ